MLCVCLTWYGGNIYMYMCIDNRLYCAWDHCRGCRWTLNVVTCQTAHHRRRQALLTELLANNTKPLENVTIQYIKKNTQTPHYLPPWKSVCPNTLHINIEGRLLGTPEGSTSSSQSHNCSGDAVDYWSSQSLMNMSHGRYHDQAVLLWDFQYWQQPDRQKYKTRSDGSYECTHCQSAVHVPIIYRRSSSSQ